jgi:alpha-tubulin suppressor-like RCC1 family protein
VPNLDLGAAVVDVALGSAHTCALLQGGTVKCWGLGDNGRLGYGDTAPIIGNLATLPALPIRDVQALAVGDAHSCVVLGNGDAKCWGLGSSGQLGYDSAASLGSKSGDTDALASITLGAPARAIAVGRAHTCTLLAAPAGSGLKCWGSGARGQLGQGDSAARGNGPGEMGKLGLVDFGTDSAGTRRAPLLVATGQLHGCAILDSFEAVCWGAGDHGALGTGAASDLGARAGETQSLRALDLGPSFVPHALCAGDAFSCALSEDGRTKCWGKNDHGQLALGDSQERGGPLAAVPQVDLGAGNAAAQLTCGLAHVCALLTSGAVKCWGRNDHGQLGLGDAQDRGGTPETSGPNLPRVPFD